MNELNCPARTHGRIAVCHFCIYVSGGPSTLCVRMLERHQQEHLAKLATVSPPVISLDPQDIPIVSSGNLS